MKRFKLHLLILALAAFPFVSCSPMTPADYSASQAQQRQTYQKFKTIYCNGQTPGQIWTAIQKAGIKPLLSDQTAYRPATGWAPRSWELLHEQANQVMVARVDRFAFGGITSTLAAVVYFHRVYYDSKGRSVGWYITHD
jgi:hypothetical protein